MNWGKWIVVSFILFAAFIATLVTVCVREDISLVTKDYYKDELVYQSQIDRLNNAEQLSQKPVISITGNDFVRVAFNTTEKIDRGELQLFCPSNERFDRHFDITSLTNNEQYFSVGDLQKGMYRARLSWSMNGKEFYMEEVIFL